MRVIVAMVMLVAVVPEFGLVEQKEKDQADQQGREQLVCADLAFKSLRQQVHEGRGQKCTGRQTEHGPANLVIQTQMMGWQIKPLFPEPWREMDQSLLDIGAVVAI
jgi:hypothetical protein